MTLIDVTRRLQPWRADSAPTDLLRLVLCAIIFTHGAYRFAEGSIPVLGTILGRIGFPAGELLAYLVNLAETGGTVLLALRLGALLITGFVVVAWDHQRRRRLQP
jgi:putative oxidoreductase